MCTFPAIRTDHPKAENGYWGQVGTEVTHYDDWSSGNRVPRYRIVLPYNPPEGSIKSLTVAGERIFAGLMNSTGSLSLSKSEKPICTTTPKPAVFSTRLRRAREIGSAMGWIDIGQGDECARAQGRRIRWSLLERVTFGKTEVIYRIHW